MSGWIKLHRSLLDWEWFSNSNMLCVFMYLLLSANSKNGRWQGIEVLAGQHITSIDKISKQTGLSQMMVRAALNKLVTTGEIEKVSTNKYTVITVVNWAFYQGEEQASNKQETNKEQTNNNQITNEEQSNNNKQEGEEGEERKEVKNTTYGEPSMQVMANNSKTDTVPYREIMELYNMTCLKLRKIQRIEGERKKHVAARYKTYGLETFKELFEKANASDFLCGENQKSWKADFDWLMNATNLPKVLEGKYDNRTGGLQNESKADVKYAAVIL